MCVVSQEIQSFAPSAVILSGGPASVYAPDSPHVGESFFSWAAEARIAVLGICYGMQEMCHALGGSVEGGHKREFGSTWVRLHDCESDQRSAKEGAFADAKALFKGIRGGLGDKETESRPHNSKNEAGDAEHTRKPNTEHQMLVWMSHGDKITKLPRRFAVGQRLMAPAGQSFLVRRRFEVLAVFLITDLSEPDLMLQAVSVQNGKGNYASRSVP